MKLNGLGIDLFSVSPGATTFNTARGETCPPGYRSASHYNPASGFVYSCQKIPEPVAAPAPATPPAVVTVNPTFQQSFTPQFSPTLQQQQDSPGASQSAEPNQAATGDQVAQPSQNNVPVTAPIPAAVSPSPQVPQYSAPAYSVPVADYSTLPGQPVSASSIPQSLPIDVGQSTIETGEQINYGKPVKKDNTLLYVGIGLAALLLLSNNPDSRKRGRKNEP